MQERDIFIAVLPKSAAERADYLAAACGDDRELRRRVEQLLAEHEREQSFFLDAPPPGMDVTTDRPVHEKPGTQIGPYKLLQQIGEGGMGVVYMAEQAQPVERRVALKIIKPGMDTRQVIARFEAERQALAMMDHQNIAKVFEAGTTDSGRPYFVMELVKGVPITKYCDEKRLSLKARLELLIPVCQAIQHAHQKGIIHRDIKPNNVLVAQYDGKPVPKVIDFGVAKATAQKLTERTMFTELGQVVGTVEYMSPEQAELNQLDIDTRSDIYSLGVLFYELLTGSTPFDKQKLRTAAFHEMLRIIREDEPPKPSANLSTSGTLASISASRHSEPAKLCKAVRGELDWIVMKALEKDRSRRYETANGLASDIQRYLNDEHVQACPPSARYRFGKFARKNRATLTTAAIVALALLIGTAVSTWQAIRATNAETQARAKEVLARNAAESERSAKQSETTQRQRAEANERLAVAAAKSEREAKGAEASQRQRAEANLQKAVEVVDRLGTRVADDSLRDVPQMEQLRKQIVQDVVSFYEGFLTQQSSDPKLRHKTANAYMHLVGTYSGLGQEAELQKCLIAANELLRELHAQQPGNEQVVVDLAYSYTYLGWREPSVEARESHFRRVNELLIPLVENREPAAQLPGMSSRLAQNYIGLADVARERREFVESEQLLERAAAFAADGDPRILAIVSEAHARLWRDLGRSSDAIAALKVALQHLEKLIAEPSKWRTNNESGYAETCRELGEMLVRDGRTTEALPHLQKAHEISDRLARAFPTNENFQQKLTASRRALIRVYQELGKSADVLQIVNELDPRTGAAYTERANLNATLGNLSRAVADYGKAIELDPADAAKHVLRGELLLRMKDDVQALDDFNRAIKIAPDNAKALVNRAGLYVRAKKYELAVADYTHVIDLNPSRWWDKKRRAIPRIHAGQYDGALADLRDALQASKDDDSIFLWMPLETIANCGNEPFKTGFLALVDEAVRVNNDSSKSRLVRARVLTAFGQFERAQSEYEHLTQLEVENPITCNRLAWLLVTCPDPAFRQPARAIALANKAIKLSPNNGAFFNTLGVAEYRAENWKAAIAALEKSAQLGENGSSFDWYFLAMAHWKLDEKEQARQRYDQAIGWQEKNSPENEELLRFRAEAAKLLGIKDDPKPNQEPTSKPDGG